MTDLNINNYLGKSDGQQLSANDWNGALGAIQGKVNEVMAAVEGVLQLQDDAVTTDKIANSAVTTDKIADYAVKEEKLNIFSGTKIKNGTILNRKLDTIYIDLDAIYAEGSPISRKTSGTYSVSRNSFYTNSFTDNEGSLVDLFEQASVEDISKKKFFVFKTQKSSSVTSNYLHTHNIYADAYCDYIGHVYGAPYMVTYIIHGTICGKDITLSITVDSISSGGVKGRFESAVVTIFDYNESIDSLNDTISQIQQDVEEIQQDVEELQQSGGSTVDEDPEESYVNVNTDFTYHSEEAGADFMLMKSHGDQVMTFDSSNTYYIRIFDENDDPYTNSPTLELTAYDASDNVISTVNGVSIQWLNNGELQAISSEYITALANSIGGISAIKLSGNSVNTPNWSGLPSSGSAYISYIS